MQRETIRLALFNLIETYLGVSSNEELSLGGINLETRKIAQFSPILVSIKRLKHNDELHLFRTEILRKAE